MKVLYSLPHPFDRLGTHQAGHVVRATNLINAMEECGITVIREEAAAAKSTKNSVGLYRRVIKNLLPKRLAMMMRDWARVKYSERYANRLIETIKLHKPDLILETHIAFSRAGKIASEKTGIPLVLDDCAPAWEEKQLYGVGLDSIANQIHREVTNHAKLLVAVNSTLRQYLLDEGISSDKVITIENGIDEKKFHPMVDGKKWREKYGISEDTVVIVFVGSYQPYHRVDILLRAFAQLKINQKVHLLLVGDGQNFNESVELARELKISSLVSFVGRTPYDIVPSYIAAGDIAVMPATNSYGNPMKIYEYLAMGLPIAAPLQPTITEILTHRKNAYLFEPENVEAVTETLFKLVDDSNLRKKLAEEGLKLASKNTWNSRAMILVNAVQKIIN